MCVCKRNRLSPNCAHSKVLKENIWFKFTLAFRCACCCLFCVCVFVSVICLSRLSVNRCHHVGYWSWDEKWLRWIDAIYYRKKNGLKQTIWFNMDERGREKKMKGEWEGQRQREKAKPTRTAFLRAVFSTFSETLSWLFPKEEKRIHFDIISPAMLWNSCSRLTQLIIWCVVRLLCFLFLPPRSFS